MTTADDLFSARAVLQTARAAFAATPNPTTQAALTSATNALAIAQAADDLATSNAASTAFGATLADRAARQAAYDANRATIAGFFTGLASAEVESLVQNEVARRAILRGAMAARVATYDAARAAQPALLASLVADGVAPRNAPVATDGPMTDDRVIARVVALVDGGAT